MDTLIRTIDGNDLVITQKEIERLGLKPGDKIVIRPEPNLVPRQFSHEELERRRAVMARLSGLWSDQDEQAFRKFRRDMWATWQPRDWS
ncbi:MAG: hypothetical protein ABI847_06050 [Anaerolineales bacterium]